ncbi:MAG TPA: hypothetical protein VLA19_09825 [Herpetosiphonaceae bacterium]|nr:hypothetical protein [Herpetosiphonaceae bacterium]
MSEPFSLADIITGVVWSSLILVVVTLVSRRSSGRSVILVGLAVKLVTSLAYNIYIVYIYGGGDTLLYHQEGIQYAGMLRAGLSGGLGLYLSTCPFFTLACSSTARLSNFTGLVHLLTFDSFTATTFVFAALGFWGQYLLYKTFVLHYPTPGIRAWWRIGILFFPTLTFWSAGILKDTLGIWGLGIALWGSYKLIQRSTMKNLFLTGLGLYIVLLFRIQIVPVLLIALAPYFLTGARSVGASNRPSLRRIGAQPLFQLFVLLLSVATIWMVGRIQPSYSFARLPVTLVTQSSVYETIEGVTTRPIITDPSWHSLVRAAPRAVFVALYRPLIGEGNGPAGLLAGVENTLLLLFSLRAVVLLVKYPSALPRAWRSPLFLTCLVFVLVFGIAVAASTPNLGTISRYRIPLIPFLIGILTIFEAQFLELRKRRLHGAEASLHSHSAPSA